MATAMLGALMGGACRGPRFPIERPMEGRFGLAAASCHYPPCLFRGLGGGLRALAVLGAPISGACRRNCAHWPLRYPRALYDTGGMDARRLTPPTERQPVSAHAANLASIVLFRH